MSPLRYLTRLLLFLGCSMACHSCATVFGGRTNSMVFTGDPAAKAEIYIDGKYIGDAPGRLRIPREDIQHGSTLEIRMEGQETRSHTILRKPHAAYVIADFAVAAIPLIIDVGTGNIYRPQPRKFDLVTPLSEQP